ncbi:MAG: rod-binding protein [Bacteriovoracaceae bacterium]|nr:rod-binding protein [Bacteriovoracaceae bacterium]
MTINSAHNNKGLKPISREEMLKPYVEVAEGMETQFSNHMIEQMRKSIPREKELSSAESYYESLMDNERAKSMAQSDTGLGLKRVILDQIVPAHLKQQPSAQQARSAYKANVKGVDE